jgi:serine/threonine protein kinase
MVKPSERLGNYEVATAADGSAQMLGSGTGGITYCGRHIHLGTEVAIKVLVRRKNLFQKDRDAFLSEARAAASLTHPQIAKIYDFGESAQQHPYYVMELCEGGSLETFGLNATSVDEYSRTQWFFEAAAALAHAHQKGILHRDIKPSNLLIARQNDSATLKLIDFGLADHADQAETSEQVIGTPHFAAPEQLRGHAGTASDVFSLGATFFWLLTGNHLSRGDLKNVIAERLSATSYAPLLSALAEPWQALLAQLLEIDPASRLRDGAEVLSALHRAFPEHLGRLAAWDSTIDRPDSAHPAGRPIHWQDFPAASWAERWAAAENPRNIPYGVTLRASRPGAAELHEVYRFNDLSLDIAELLIQQADLVARYASELGLGSVLLERGPQWWSVAWPALGFDDALSWVRRGQTTSTAEMLSALDPIATALDGMKSGGFMELEIHPAMLIVAAGAPLKFSLAIPLPVVDSQEAHADSGGTMRGASGTSLSARFGSCVYQLLSGRTPPPAAFLNARAYQAIPKLSERSNRFLASVIAGTLAGGTSRDVIRGLAYEERIPGASYSGTMTSSGSLGSRSSERWSQPPANLPLPTLAMPPPLAVTAPARMDELPGTSATAPARMDELPGTSGAAPARMDEPPGTSGGAPARMDELPGTSGGAPARMDEPPGTSGGAPARMDELPGTSGGAVPPLTLAPGTSAGPPPMVATRPPQKKPPILAIVASLAAVLLLALVGAGWYFLPQLKKLAAPTLAAMPKVPPPKIAGEPAAKPPTKVAPPAADPNEPLSLVKVPDDAASIGAALLRCKDGGTIEIGAGSRSEAIVLTKSVSLVSKAGALLEDGGLGSSLITVRGPIKVTLQNLQIRNTQKQATTTLEASPPLVLIADGANVVFEGCVVESSVGDGISLADKAAATFSNCRIRKNRGTGIRVTSSSKIAVSLSEIQDNGGSGLTLENVGSSAALASGSSINGNSEHGIEISNGAELTATGAEMKSNQKVGIILENGGSSATLEAGCVISDNRMYGIGVRNSGRLKLADATLEDNTENGIYLESGGAAEITGTRFKSNGTIGLYIVNGSESKATIDQSTFESHSQAGVAIVDGSAKVTGCRFTNNPMALFYGNGASGSATANTIFPGPLTESVVTENAGVVTLTDNTVGTGQ